MDAAEKDRRTGRDAEILVLGGLGLYRRGLTETTLDCPETASQDMDIEACWCLGGAAGIAGYIHRLGGAPVLAGTVAGDPEGKRLLSMLKQAGIPSVFRLPKTQKTQAKECCAHFGEDMAQIHPNWAEGTQAHAFEAMVTIFGSMPEVGLVLIAEDGQRCVSDQLISDLSAMCKHRGIPLYAYGGFEVFKRYKDAELICGYAEGRVCIVGSGGKALCSFQVHAPQDAEVFMAYLACQRVMGILTDKTLQDYDGREPLWASQVLEGL